jgi:hypothetical protein
VTEQSWLRCDSFEKGLKLVEVVGQADPDESGALLVGTQAVAGQVWGMAGPTELLERGLELIENPAASLAPWIITMSLAMASVPCLFSGEASLAIRDARPRPSAA